MTREYQVVVMAIKLKKIAFSFMMVELPVLIIAMAICLPFGYGISAVLLVLFCDNLLQCLNKIFDKKVAQIYPDDFIAYKTKASTIKVVNSIFFVVAPCMDVAFGYKNGHIVLACLIFVLIIANDMTQIVKWNTDCYRPKMAERELNE